MKRTDLKEDSSVFFINKWFIIIAILITASLSFTLGYFVGKSYQPTVVNQTSLIPLQEGSKQKIVGTEEKEVFVQQPQDTSQTQQTKETQKTEETKMAKETGKTSKTRRYTVQAGVFKNESEANDFKARLDKKGYKTYVVPSVTKNHEKLYKVRIGEFNTRNEAEVLSIKIKKSEGLNTFVTFNTE